MRKRTHKRGRPGNKAIQMQSVCMCRYMLMHVEANILCFPAGYHPTHPVILFFWQAVEMFDNEQRLRLLQVHIEHSVHIV